GGVASYVSGSGGTVLKFKYVVGDTGSSESTSDIAVTGFKANGGSISASGGIDTSTYAKNPSGTQAIDVTAPTVSITTSDSLLNSSDTAHLTFTTSESTSNFSANDVSVSGGTLSNFGGSGTVYTADFKANSNSTTSATISVAAGRFEDGAGNDNTAGSPQREGEKGGAADA